MSSAPRTPKNWHTLPRPGRWFVAAMVALSILIHVGSFVNLDYLASRFAGLDFKVAKQPPVKIKTITMKKEKKKDEDEELANRGMIEVPQTKTEKPKQDSFLGAQDHATDREKKLALQPNQPKAADAGQKGKKQDSQVTAQPEKKPETLAKRPPTQGEKADQKPKRPLLTTDGTMSIGVGKEQRKQTGYESMLPTMQEDLQGQVNAGYQEYVQDNVEIGDRIDINTTNYRYIGYFTGLRKAIELVWIYPSEAVRRGMEGEVRLEFKIEKDGHAGHVKVLRSSGYEVLDRAIVEAIKLASPYAPLPDGLGKDRLVVTASFRYILYASYAGGH